MRRCAAWCATGPRPSPPSIALATSFDTTLMDRVCTAIALETKARGIRMVLSPLVNLDTDLRWGLAEVVCGEDPLLASWMGATCVKARESRGIPTAPKHFAVNHGDGGRDSYPMFGASATYNKPFQACIQQGGMRSILTAYTLLEGRPCSANGYLLNEARQEVMERGKFRLMIGGSSKDIRLRTVVELVVKG